MIALAILAGLLTTILYTVSSQLKAVSRQRALTAVGMLASTKMNEMEKKPRKSEGAFEPPFEKFTYSTEIRKSDFEGIKIVTVTVTDGTESFVLEEFVLR